MEVCPECHIPLLSLAGHLYCTGCLAYKVTAGSTIAWWEQRKKMNDEAIRDAITGWQSTIPSDIKAAGVKEQERLAQAIAQAQAHHAKNGYDPLTDTTTQRKVPSMLFLLGRFLGKWALILYIPIAFLSGGWNYHRACLPGNVAAMDVNSHGDQITCALLSGASWPIWNAVHFALWITDPANLPGIPTITIQKSSEIKPASKPPTPVNDGAISKNIFVEPQSYATTICEKTGNGNIIYCHRSDGISYLQDLRN